MKKVLMALLMFCLVGCGIGDTNTTYRRAEIGKQGSTSVGRIISMTQIEIAGSSEGGTLVGAGVGGVAGGIAGSSIGRGHGSSLMAVAGATVGALAGAAVGGAAQQAPRGRRGGDRLAGQPGGPDARRGHPGWIGA